MKIKMRFLVLSMISLLGFLIAPAVEAQEAFPFTAEVTVDKANLRAGQNENFEVLGQLSQGDEVVVVDKSFDWRKIKLPASAKAYVSAAFLKDQGENVSKVTGNRLNVRAGMSTTAAVLCQLKKDDLVRVLETKNDWIRIEPPDACFGWMIKDNLKFKKQELLPLRVVEAPIRNIYVKKRMAAAKGNVLPPGMAAATGIVEDLGDKALSPDIRHRMKVEGAPGYYLQGYRQVLDGFAGQTVKIEGKTVTDFRSDAPVVLVTKINLVM